MTFKTALAASAALMVLACASASMAQTTTNALPANAAPLPTDVVSCQPAAAGTTPGTAKKCTLAQVVSATPPSAMATALRPQNTPWNANNGMTNFGDSVTAGFGTTVFPTNGYANLMAVDFVNGVGKFNNLGVSGDDAADVATSMFTNLNPTDSGNPIVTVMDGINDRTNDPNKQVVFQQILGSGIVRAAISNTNTVAAAAALVTAAGAWSSDTTFANLTGETSTTNGSTLTLTSANFPGGVFYLYYRINNRGGTTTGGSFTVSVDGTVVADTVSGASPITTLPFGGATYPSIAALPTAPALARFPVASGIHTVVVTVTSPTLSTNPVQILGFAIPNGQIGGQSAPRVAVGGTIFQQNGAQENLQAPMNVLNQQMAAQFAADGLDVRFANVRAYINSTTDMASVATQNCPASTAPGLHPNDCGHRHLAQAFEDTIAATSAPLTQPLNLSGLPVPATQDLANGQTVDDGTHLAAGGHCVSTFLGYCWGETMLLAGGRYTNILMAGNTSSMGFGFSFAPAHPTTAQVLAGLAYKFSEDNSMQWGTAGAGVTANEQLQLALAAPPTSLSGYHEVRGSGTSSSGLIGGLDIGDSGVFGGIHWLFDTTHSAFAFGVYAPNNENICSFFYPSGTTPTAASNFTCPDYVTPTGDRDSNSFTAATAFIAGGSAPAGSGSCSIGTQTGGNTVGFFKTPSACSATTATLTFSKTAPTGYVCHVTDMTSAAIAPQTSSSLTSCTVKITSGANDNFAFSAMAG